MCCKKKIDISSLISNRIAGIKVASCFLSFLFLLTTFFLLIRHVESGYFQVYPPVKKFKTITVTSRNPIIPKNDSFMYR